MVTSGGDQASARPSEGVLYQLEKSGLMTNEYVRLIDLLDSLSHVTFVSLQGGTEEDHFGWFPVPASLAPYAALGIYT